MTSYVEILNTQIDVDSPVTTGLMTQIRDNPIAITEGAVGAPKIQTDAVQDLAITEPKLADGAISIDKLAGSVQTPRAWIKTNGTTILDSFNVASISFANLGASGFRTTVTLVDPMANTNYAILTSANGNGNVSSFINTSSLTTSFRVEHQDAIMSAVIFGDV